MFIFGLVVLEGPHTWLAGSSERLRVFLGSVESRVRPEIPSSLLGFALKGSDSKVRAGNASEGVNLRRAAAQFALETALFGYGLAEGGKLRSG